ncbi:unnamed protein product [Clonostachys rosea]|uniref:Uncharacterized protein n=1 Tax=Bionectria ochroleuca TaxID=29856 RepID=A0ABY6U6K1_BIOOC|nr:unnamed protein product [Clonostachys rosea]
MDQGEKQRHRMIYPAQAIQNATFADNAIGRRQKEKIAALEAQAKVKELLEPLIGDQEVPRFEEHAELVSRARSKSEPNVGIEEVARSCDGFDLPEIDFRTDSVDLSLRQYFGK